MATSLKRKQAKAKTYISLPDEQCLNYVTQAYIDEGSMGQTSRHYYYKLLGYQAVQTLPLPTSARQAYAFVCRLLVKARRRGLLPWEAVIDPGRRRSSYSSWYLEEYARAKMSSYITFDMWRGQEAKGVEVWVEKDTMMAFVDMVLRPYRIPVQVNRGYGSAAAIKDASDRYGTGKGWILLYIGDFDPSGMDIDRSLRDILRNHGCRPHIVRIALHQEDTVNLMPNAGLELKPKDPRYQRFVAQYGTDQQAYEIDSLGSHLLRRRISEQLGLYVDLDEFAQMRELERSVNTLFEKKLKGTLNDLTQAMLSRGISSPRLTLTHEQQLRYYLPPEKDDEEREEYIIEENEADENEYEEESDD